MMTEHTKKHLWYYISFLAVELTGLGLVFYLSYDNNLQFFSFLFFVTFSVHERYAFFTNTLFPARAASKITEL